MESAALTCGQMRRVARALHLDMPQRCLDFGQVGRGKIDVISRGVLFEPMQLGRALTWDLK